MKRLLLLAAGLLFILNCFAQVTPVQTDLMDSFLNQLYKHDKFMGTATIYKNGTVLYDRQMGEGKIEKKNWKPDADSKYRIGSISKMYTTAMVFQLIEEGKLTLDTKLDKYYPQIKYSEKITIRQMLNHHSGIYSFTSMPDYLKWSTEPRTKEEILKRITDEKPAFKPGKDAEYSNSNFVLLGYIIEDIEGKPYNEVLNERIIKKIGLKHTNYGVGHKKDKNEAPSFLLMEGGWSLYPETDMSIPHGAGAIVATSKEMGMFATALFQGKLMPLKWVDTMMTIEDNYGMGVFKYPYYGQDIYGHTGGIDGFVSMLTYNPNDSVVITLSCNALNYNNNEIVKGLANIYYGKEFTIPDFSSQPMDEQEGAKYEGMYTSKDLPLDIKIFYKDGGLMAQATGQGAFPLDVKGDGKFEFPAAGITIQFEELKEGKYQTMKFTQGGKLFNYTRKE